MTERVANLVYDPVIHPFEHAPLVVHVLLVAALPEPWLLDAPVPLGRLPLVGVLLAGDGFVLLADPHSFAPSAAEAPWLVLFGN